MELVKVWLIIKRFPWKLLQALALHLISGALTVATMLNQNVPPKKLTNV